MLSRTGTLDEFAVPEEAQEMLLQHRPQIEHLFQVELNVLGILGMARNCNGEPQGEKNIWLQLQGCRENLRRAKEYIKGLCAPELRKEVHYPQDMHCIFLGAQSLFLDCLIQGTSASLTLLRSGSLLISGLAEAFVMAESRIQEFVAKYQKNPKLEEEQEARVKRAFRELVEAYDDKHAMDLLILPTSVKEDLLSLVKETRGQRLRNGCCIPEGCGQDHGRPQDISDVPVGLSRVREQGRRGDCGIDLPEGVARLQEAHKIQDSAHPEYSARPRPFRTDSPTLGGGPQDQIRPHVSRIDLLRGLAKSEANTSPPDSPAGLNGLQGWPEAAATPGPMHPESALNRIPAGRTTHNTPLFPGNPGLMESLEDRQEERKQVRELSPVSLPEESSEEEEPSSDFLLSSWTEKEFKMRLDFFKTMGYEERVVKKVLLEGGMRDAPSTILDRVQMEEAGLSQKDDPLPPKELGKRGVTPPPLEKIQGESDYLMEVIKAAVANCGHSPSEILPELQTGAPLAGLLRRLNRKGECNDEAQRVMAASATKSAHGGQHGSQVGAILNQEESAQHRHPQETRRNGGSPFLEVARVPPLDPPAAVLPPDRTPKANRLLTTWDSVASQSAGSTNPAPPSNAPVSTVTGAQRFEEALQTQFKLKLANVPGKKNLRRVIIDGSNLAMMHGLNQFFSCRGIALAVQHFWERGHREVTVFVPAYRLEEDSNVREQHFLTELRDLSILSVTPSRKVGGKGIVPYDDRLMLSLAEQTSGIIVTNDQFRDLAKESKRWIGIIKESVLQYTFVGDIFMVPDDPLGRGGPNLMEFLKKTHRTKPPNCHSFNGRGAPMPVPFQSASQTEVLRLRDRRPPGSFIGDHQTKQQDKVVEEELLEKTRPREETERLRVKLLEIFVGQHKKIDFVLLRDPCSHDLNKLSEAILNLHF